MGDRPRDHEDPKPWQEVAAAAEPGAPLLVARGQYAPTGEAIRVGLLRAGRCLADAWVVDADVDELVRALRCDHEVRVGEWDVMYATGWSYAWATDPGPVFLMDSAGLLAWSEGADLLTREGGRCPAAAIVDVEVYLEEGWSVRGVRVRVEGGPPLPIAEERDPFALIDPTYDGLNLMCDASWAVGLGRALGAALRVPVALDEDLR